MASEASDHSAQSLVPGQSLHRGEEPNNTLYKTWLQERHESNQTQSLEKPKTSGNIAHADGQRMAAGDRGSGEKGQVWSIRQQQTEPTHTEKQRMTTNIKAIESKVACFSLLNKSLCSFLSSPEANTHKS